MNTCCNLYFYLRVEISDCRSEIKIALEIVDMDDTKLSQRGAMTLVIELEQLFEIVTQVRTDSSFVWCWQGYVSSSLFLLEFPQT